MRKFMFAAVLINATMLVALRASAQNTFPATGNVGIFTPNPDFPLDVAGTSRSNLHIFRSNQPAPIADAFVFRPSDNTLAFGTASAERMRIAADGKIGMGTPNPNARLEVFASTNNVVEMLRLRNDCTVCPGAYIGWNQQGTELARIAVANDVAGEYTMRFFTFASGASAERMVIRGNGYVGIGATNPAAPLHARRTLAGNSDQLSTAEVLRLENSDGDAYAGAHLSFYFNGVQGARIAARNDLDGAYNLKFFTYNAYDAGGAGIGNVPKMTLTGAGQLLVGLTTPPSDATAIEKVFVNGDIRVSGNINAKYRDVAEWVPVADALTPGTVVSIAADRDDHVVASGGAYATNVAGVVSASPGIALGERGLDKALIATTGRVKVRVEASTNPIARGDLLVASDIPGIAMKSIPVTSHVSGVVMHRPGTIIGKALEPLDSGKGEILALLTLQ